MVNALEKKKDPTILLLLFSGWCLSSVNTLSLFEPGQPLAQISVFGKSSGFVANNGEDAGDISLWAI